MATPKESALNLLRSGWTCEQTLAEVTDYYEELVRGLLVPAGGVGQGSLRGVFFAGGGESGQAEGGECREQASPSHHVHGPLHS